MAVSFTDVDGDVVSFTGTKTTEKTVAECSVSTVDIISCEQSSQSLEKYHVEVQTDAEVQAPEPDYDRTALLEFMRKMAPKVENELRRVTKYFGPEYAEKLSEEDAVLTKKICCLSTSENTKDFKVSYISWNCYSNKIAVTLNRKIHEQNQTPSSYILIYECDQNDEFKSTVKHHVEVDFRITRLKFHPTISSILVYTTEQCRLTWHDLNESMEINSRNFTELGASAVNFSWVNLEFLLYLAVAATDSYLYLISANSVADARTIYRIFLFEENIRDHPRGIHCFDFSALNSQRFIVALFGGLLVNCSFELAKPVDESRNIYNPVLSFFDCPKVVVNDVRYSNFESDIFVTSASDEYLRIYRTSLLSPIYVIAADCVPFAVEWSHLQEHIVKVWNDGELRFYNYRQCAMVKCMKFEDRFDSVASSVKGMRELIAIGNLEEISIWQTGLIISLGMVQ